MQHYALSDQSTMNYVGLQTPDKKYYVGIDMPSAMHPQTLLCYEMNGQPLPINQGFPVRLIIPAKYGIKHLKRIGTMFLALINPPTFGLKGAMTITPDINSRTVLFSFF
jgi:DMSO/TMAO reductase YedYZ molybdopterin-dependent catalytic subunit